MDLYIFSAWVILFLRNGKETMKFDGDMILIISNNFFLIYLIFMLIFRHLFLNVRRLIANI